MVSVWRPQDNLTCLFSASFYLFFETVSLVSQELCLIGQVSWSTGFWGSCYPVPFSPPLGLQTCITVPNFWVLKLQTQVLTCESSALLTEARG